MAPTVARGRRAIALQNSMFMAASTRPSDTTTVLSRAGAIVEDLPG